MKIFIGADHRGFELKEKIKTWLEAETHQVIDCGNDHFDKDDDFPDFSINVAQKVVGEEKNGVENVRGIVICGSGVGVNIAANKVLGARASTAIHGEEVRHARKHDDLNVLAISADYTSFEEAKDMIQIFLTEEFLAQEKYVRRLEKIHNFENKNT